jgi:hypothetical protein
MLVQTGEESIPLTWDMDGVEKDIVAGIIELKSKYEEGQYSSPTLQTLGITHAAPMRYATMPTYSIEYDAPVSSSGFSLSVGVHIPASEADIRIENIVLFFFFRGKTGEPNEA